MSTDIIGDMDIPTTKGTIVSQIPSSKYEALFISWNACLFLNLLFQSKHILLKINIYMKYFCQHYNIYLKIYQDHISLSAYSTARLALKERQISRLWQAVMFKTSQLLI